MRLQELLDVVMAASITHNIDKVIKDLNIYQRSTLPRAARTTISRLGYTLAKKDIPRYMKEVYNNPNNLTLSSLNYKVESNYKVRLSFRDNVPKGNSPSRYLEPTTKGTGNNVAYETKFTRMLRSTGAVSGNEYPRPVTSNLAVGLGGKVKPYEYARAWSGLTSSLPRSRSKTELNSSLSFGGAKRKLSGFNRNNNFRHFSKDRQGRIFMGAQIQKPPTPGSLFDFVKPGIYRIKGLGQPSVLQLLFTYLPVTPAVPEIFDYYGQIERQVNFRVAPMLREALK